MDRIKKLNSSRCGLLIAMTAVFIVMFVLNCMTPYLVDDYGYMYSYADGTRVRTISGLIQSMYQHCFKVNGR